MNYFSIKLGLNASALQPEIMDKLKSMQIDVIQVSDGIFAKTYEDAAVVRDALTAIDSSLSMTTVNPQNPDLSKDAQAFLGLKKMNN